MIRLAGAVLVLLAVAALSACGSAAHPAPDWYARGKAFAVADYKAGDTGNIGAYLPWPYFCTEVLSDHGSKGTSGVGVPLNAPPTTEKAPLREWILGCAAGYKASQP